MTKVMKAPLIRDNDIIVKDVIDMSFFSLTGKESNTKGTSNKSYFMEINVSKNSTAAQIHSCWGPTGGHQVDDWRHYISYDAAKKDFEKIIKSKNKKGYRKVDMALRAHGSDGAKQITKPVTFSNLETNNFDEVKTSLLPAATQRLMEKLFGATQQFVVTTLKCPLGQLTNDQIDRGRGVLGEAKKFINKKINQTKLEELTNDFYTLIPHNLGSGARGKLTHLLLDSELKIAQKEADLDTLLDAKSVGAVLSADSAIDAQYKALNADINWIEPNDPLFAWINNLVVKTKAKNHYSLNNIKVLNAWKLTRHNCLNDFNQTATSIAEACKGQVIPDMFKGLGIRSRFDITDDRLYKQANILPLFHGTRTQNVVGITKQGLLIRPSTAVITGAMYGPGVYNGYSTKAAQYSDIRASYWANGKDSNGFLFITDTILGEQKIAKGAYNYSKQNIKPNHSVWAKGGYSGVINDEFITYNVKQVMLRYLIEFTS